MRNYQLPFNEMEAFLLIPESEWQQIVSRLERLEKVMQQAEEAAHVLPPDEILAVQQAAARLGMTPEGIRKARRAGRLKGVRIKGFSLQRGGKLR